MRDTPRFAIGQVSKTVESSLSDSAEHVRFFAVPVGFLVAGDREAEAVVGEYERRRGQIAAEIESRIAAEVRSDPSYLAAEAAIKQIDAMLNGLDREVRDLEDRVSWSARQQSSDALLSALRRGESLDDTEAEGERVRSQIATLRTRKQRLFLARTAATKERENARESIVSAIKEAERAALLARVAEIADRIAPAVVREFAELYAAKRVAADLDPLRL